MPIRFGSSGIRGPYPEQVNPALSLHLGKATGALARRILVGHDVRLTSPLLAQAFAAGALSTGAHVAWAGPAATPSLAWAARDHDATVVVTASHNPPPDNGFKFWNPDGSAWKSDQEAALLARLETALPRAAWNRLVAPTSASSVSDGHRQAILRFAGPTSGRVLLDCGNGSGAYVSPSLFQEAGLNVDVLFGNPDGRFPHRPSEPTEAALVELRSACARAHTWGIAHDGDADRMVAVDTRGHVVPPDVVLVALALLRGARRIATPIDRSLALETALPGVRWDLTRVGDAAVSAALRAHGGDLGAETSGTYIVSAFDYAPDGPLAALLFLKAAAQGLVDEARRRLLPTVRISEKHPLAIDQRERLAQALADAVPDEKERATRVDGLRIDTEEGWFLIRPSGTEAVLRLMAEARTREGAHHLMERARALAARARGLAAAPQKNP